MSEQQSESNEEAGFDTTMRRLSDVIREVKNSAADRDDVVVDLREAQKMRLELLVKELEPITRDIPDDNDQFDLALSSGLQPRFWIDSVAHVTMGRDKRSYRFVRDTRQGRIVLAETQDVKAVAEQVSRYIAERIVERERAMEGDIIGPASVNEGDESGPIAKEKAGSGFLEGFLIFLLGVLAGGLLLIGLLWERLEALGLDFWNRPG